MVILLITIDGYSIVAINGYFINDYWWLLVAIGGYYIINYYWLFYVILRLLVIIIL
jgi:hypothetical protein